MPNPFYRDGRWWYTDARGDKHGPYRTQRRAMRNLLRHCCGWETLRQRLRRAIVEFWHDTRGAS